MWSKHALDFVIGYEDVQVDAALYSDHQRYFFQQISTVRAPPARRPRPRPLLRRAGRAGAGGDAHLKEWTELRR